MQKTRIKGVIMLFLAAFIWGSSFVAQFVGMKSIGAFTFNGIRTLLGALFLAPIILIKDAAAAKKDETARFSKKSEIVKALKYGSILGVALCIASNFQQFAFAYKDASAGKIAFITAFYMFFVPLIGFVIFKKKAPPLIWFCVILGTAGLYLLCVGKEGLSSVTASDLLALVCSVFFAIHILLIEKFVACTDNIKLSCVQFLVSGTLSFILMLIFEKPNIKSITSCAAPILYSGVMSCGVAYTFQIIGQKYTESTLASLILCLESVFGVLSGAVFLHEVLEPREAVGCVIMFAAVVLSQLGDKKQNLFRRKKL